MGSVTQLALFAEEFGPGLVCADSEPKPYHCPRINDEEGDRCIRQALAVLERRFKSDRQDMSHPQAIKDYLRLRIGGLDYEMFGVAWLDAKHRLIEFSPMFRGTISETRVWPREVVREALQHNAAFCVIFHNHPSGCCDPSRADEALTDTLKQALRLIDVRVLDHVVVSWSGTVSMAERGLL